MAPAPLLYACGQLEIDHGRRELRVSGVAVALGGRAFEVLEVLVRAAGGLVTKNDFMQAVWADSIVEENTLQVHISAVRKALGQDRKLLQTVSGRGYRLLGNWAGREDVGPVTVFFADRPAVSDPDPSHNLPVRLKRMVGRDADVRTVLANLATERFVSVIGPGGIGKTTVAIAVGEAFDGAVRFVDLSAAEGMPLVADAIASALRLTFGTQEMPPSIIASVRATKILLILDSCEHSIDHAGRIAERLYGQEPRVHILATSREALRIEGERLHTLLPLDAPSETMSLTLAEATTFPAIELFVERAVAGDSAFRFSDAEVPLVAAMCRSLDGLPLAIELAAGRVGAFGVRESAGMLDAGSPLLWRGHRSALPRHLTLAAAIDWSHDLLSADERTVLRRLSIFVGTIVGLEPLLAVASDAWLSDDLAVNAIDGLVAKSLIEADVSTPVIRYRMLATIRAYAMGKLTASGELLHVSERYANFVGGFPMCQKGARPALPRKLSIHESQLDKGGDVVERLVSRPDCEVRSNHSADIFVPSCN